MSLLKSVDRAAKSSWCPSKQSPHLLATGSITSTINSSTKLLPAWKKVCVAVKLPVRMMPRYVATRWNSMFQLLEFAYRYRVAIDKFTEARENGVRDLELSREEWATVKELRDVLKVR